MKMVVRITYADGTSAPVEIEKPAGAHPTSPAAVMAAIEYAEAEFGKQVATVSPYAVDYRTATRGEVAQDYIDSRS